MIQAEKKKLPPLAFSKPPHVAVIEARFYDHINDLSLAGAVAVLEHYGATHELIRVPGALEIPSAVQFAAQSGRFDAYVALGCVIRGATSHYETVCAESTRGLTDVALKHHIAIGNGILTVENETQALERADKNQLDKGGGAALAALIMLTIKRRF